ncbi:MAG: Asp-tRNA(Asn)/Glu-tRNA(Gln) amidotransferase subunit GatB [Clostridia bacterium]|nr:Asp-tRNA(Asn)/Glu-tRNA(Gln) amidotransferase subunit GatB [Clostridia bacterium]
MSFLEQYDIVIGLEIHAELNTKTKVFCGCKNQFGQTPNTNTCPVCTGMPGALPILNKHAVELAIKSGLSFGCSISPYSVFERKNYFYPDLSKAYQISQLVYPLCVGGHITLDSGKTIRLNRIHLEEDAGKLTHLGKAVGSLVDYNRGGTPLIEMVTEPDLSSANEAVEFLKKVREALIFEEIANCKMEEGGMRCDVNLSLKKKGSQEFGTRTEMKNLNSFKSVQRAIEYEAERQAEVLASGGVIVQETRKWDDERGESFAMRSKEQAQDYRYFPDPDLLPVRISNEDVEHIKKEMVMLPGKRRQRYMEEFGLPEYDAQILTSTKYISDYFEKCVQYFNAPKKISNWIMVDILKLVKDQEEFTFPISEEYLSSIIKMVEEKTINKTVGLQLLDKVIETGKEPLALAKEMNLLVTITDEQIIQLLEKLKSENSKVVDDFKKTPEKVIGFIVGYVMKNTGGKANSNRVRELIAEKF